MFSYIFKIDHFGVGEKLKVIHDKHHPFFPGIIKWFLWSVKVTISTASLTPHWMKGERTRRSEMDIGWRCPVTAGGETGPAQLNSGPGSKFSLSALHCLHHGQTLTRHRNRSHPSIPSCPSWTHVTTLIVLSSTTYTGNISLICQTCLSALANPAHAQKWQEEHRTPDWPHYNSMYICTVLDSHLLKITTLNAIAFPLTRHFQTSKVC